MEARERERESRAHLPYRRVDIGNLAKTNAGRSRGAGGEALQMPAWQPGKHEYFVLHFRFALYTLSLHFVSGGKHLTALGLQEPSRHCYRFNCSCSHSPCTLEREAIISEMSNRGEVGERDDCVIIIAETILSLISH